MMDAPFLCFTHCSSVLNECVVRDLEDLRDSSAIDENCSGCKRLEFVLLKPKLQLLYYGSIYVDGCV